MKMVIVRCKQKFHRIGKFRRRAYSMSEFERQVYAGMKFTDRVLL
nr:MAG TPA: hypothetical protein [Caudoviricetes sp.]